MRVKQVGLSVGTMTDEPVSKSPVNSRSQVNNLPELPPKVISHDRRAPLDLPAVGRARRSSDKERSLESTIKWAAALGGRALVLAAAMAAVGCATVSPSPQSSQSSLRPPRAPTSMSQLDYPKASLGNGDRRTIAEAGCFLTSLAMASETLTTKKWDPLTANAQVKKAGAFSGPALEMPEAAQALGLTVTWRGALSSGNAQAKHEQMRAHIEAGHAAVACVDLGPGSTSGVSEGDHFILVYGAGPHGTFYGVDPAGGHTVTLSPDKEQGFLRYGEGGSRRICELVLLKAK